jgi:hypothetical protein
LEGVALVKTRRNATVEYLKSIGYKQERGKPNVFAKRREYWDNLNQQYVDTDEVLSAVLVAENGDIIAQKGVPPVFSRVNRK